MADTHSQATYQVRLGWGAESLTHLAPSEIVVVVDALGSSTELEARAASLPPRPAVFAASLRNATATARAVYAEQLARGGRTAIDLVLAGDVDAAGSAGLAGFAGFAGFAVEDYLAAGAVADALTALGIDHSSPDVAVATEGFRALTRALKHLLSASAAGQELVAAGRRDEVRHAAELDADDAARRIA